MPIISTNQKLAQATPLIDLHGSGQILFFFLTAYINTSQLISNTTIPNDNMFHTPRNPKPRKPRTALVWKMNYASYTELFKELKNGIGILVGQAVFEL